MSEIIIEAEGLTKQYMKHKAVNDVSFGIKKGGIYGLIGPNGAGKTTIMKMLGGLVIPTSGKISVFGKSSDEELTQARQRMSFIIETPYAKAGMTAAENLEKQRLQKGITDKNRIKEVLETAGLSDTGKKSVKAFSLGMKQRLGIANALMTKPEIMVLDEPINGLDPEGIIQVRELLKKLNTDENITILISSHILSELSLLCTDYLFINHGRIISSLTGDELKAECSGYYHIHTDNDGLAASVLGEKLGIKNFDVREDGSIRLFERLDDIRSVSKSLYDNGVIPLELNMNEANLEEYYMNMVGGADNAEHNKSA